ncbi:hypothetical protein AGMMS49579_02680 [Spirochaetia bacterium]|nr:hypothetical protein AGMMS49579_02680 [Spirochaetia bacterium]
MAGLNHQIIYRADESLFEHEWKEVKYDPLRINDKNILENEYFEIYDDILRYFHDMFYWVKMYNPSKKESTKGFCNWDVTIIKGEKNYQN